MACTVSRMTPSRTRRAVAGGLRALWGDLSPAAGSPLPPAARAAAAWLGWLPQALVAALATAAGWSPVGRSRAAAPGRAGRGPGDRPGHPPGRPAPADGRMVAVAGRDAGQRGGAGRAAGPVWAEPSLLAHLGVLALVGLQARPRVLLSCGC